jgi:hypothetical protein
MVMLEAVVVVAVLGLLVYGTIMLLSGTRASGTGASGTGPSGTRGSGAQAVGRGTWRVTHYEASGATRVVVQKVAPDGVRLIEEHLVDTIGADDPAYEDRFLTAMATARQRQALFEAED